MTAGATSGDHLRSWPEILANAARAAGGLRALGRQSSKRGSPQKIRRPHLSLLD